MNGLRYFILVSIYVAVGMNLSVSLSQAQEQASVTAATAQEQAKQAKEYSQMALEKADKALETAQEANNTSKEALIISNNNSQNIKETKESTKEQFDTVKNLFYFFSSAAGIILVISTVLDYKRRKNEQNQMQKITDAEQFRFEKMISVESQRFTEMLTRQDKVDVAQVKLLGELGNVINLINETFKLQKESMEELKNFKESMEGYAHFYQDQFNDVYENLERFQNYDRMKWTKLSKVEQELIRSSRIRFMNIPSNIIEKMEKKEKVAKMYNLLGIGSFYENDIISASNLFDKSAKLYQELSQVQKDGLSLYMYAFTLYYRGLIEKNWLVQSNDISENLENSRNLLKEASEIFINRENEILTPLTYAEVLTYLPNETEHAHDSIDKCLQNLENLGKKGELDPNQKKLFSRAYLLKGNIFFIQEKFDQSQSMYEKAIEKNQENFYAFLSLDQTLRKMGNNEWKNQVQTGIQKLVESKSLEKPEVTTYGMVLAWVTIASCWIDHPDKGMYRELFNSFVSTVDQIGNRIPLFFCPIVKRPVKIAQLKESVDKECEFVKDSSANL